MLLDERAIDVIAAGPEPEIAGKKEPPFMTDRQKLRRHLQGILEGIETAIGIMGETRNLCESHERISDELASVTERGDSWEQTDPG